MRNCSFVGVIRPTLFYKGIGQTPCSYEHYLVSITAVDGVRRRLVDQSQDRTCSAM